MDKRSLLHEINNARQMLDYAVELIEQDAPYGEIEKMVWRSCQLTMDADRKITDELCRLEEISWENEANEKLDKVKKYIEGLQ